MKQNPPGPNNNKVYQFSQKTALNSPQPERFASTKGNCVSTAAGNMGGIQGVYLQQGKGALRSHSFTHIWNQQWGEGSPWVRSRCKPIEALTQQIFS